VKRLGVVRPQRGDEQHVACDCDRKVVNVLYWAMYGSTKKLRDKTVPGFGKGNTYLVAG
jgi:hypothetical protein